MTSKRALIIARVGDQSLHPAWVYGQTYRERAFDLHLSYFGERQDPFGTLQHGTTLSFEKGGKWDGLYCCLTRLESKLSEYDWICLPDDDLWAQAPVWSRFFAFLDVLNPRIAQPALTRNSFYSHDITLQRKNCAARWTNFVEVMCPAFRREALVESLNLLALQRSGWGLDYIWQRQAQGSQHSLAIVDATPVLHTRAVRSGPLYKVCGIDDSESDLERLAPNCIRETPQSYQAVNERGEPVQYFSLNRKLILPRRLHKWRKHYNRRSIVPASAPRSAL